MLKRLVDWATIILAASSVFLTIHVVTLSDRVKALESKIEAVESNSKDAVAEAEVAAMQTCSNAIKWTANLSTEVDELRSQQQEADLMLSERLRELKKKVDHGK